MKVDAAGRPRVIVVLRDDDPVRRRTLAEIARAAGAELIVASDEAPPRGIDTTATLPFGVVSLGAGAGRACDAGLAAIRALARWGARVIAYGERLHDWPIGLRCRALLAGAVTLFDSSDPHLADQIWARVEHLRQTEVRIAQEQEEVRSTFRELGIVGQSEVMGQVCRWTVRVGRLSDLHTLITGETGTGKQLFAQAIHQLDPKRRAGPFVVVNCAAISPALAESELFGHKRGAFTGADRERKGLIRAAHGGVVLLDEIGEMDLALQAKLLRVIQEGRVLGVGEDHEVPVDVRVIAATHRHLDEMVANRTFRADLFHRLTVLSVRIPPLRDRREDIEPLVRHVVEKYAHLGTRRPPLIGTDFLAALSRAELPGNAREVENLVRQAIVRHDGEHALTLSDLPAELWTHVSALESSRAAGSDDTMPRDGAADAALSPDYLRHVLATNDWNLSRSLASFEKILIEGALRSANGNQARAARLLGVTPRSVYNKLRKYHLPTKSA